MANNVLFKTSLLKGPQGDRGEAGEAEAVPVDGILAYDGEEIPEGYEETEEPQAISYLENAVDTLEDAVEQNTNDISSLNTSVSNNTQNIATQTARIDQIANLPSGSTSGDAELQDIRVGFNGKTYTDAGTAVREQVSDINKNVECLFSRMGKGYDNNLLFGVLLTKGGYFGTNGSIVANNDYWYSDYIAIEPSTVYRAETRGACFLNYYTSNKTYISNYISYNNDAITTPSNAYYIRVSLSRNYINTAKMFKDLRYEIYGKMSIKMNQSYNGTIDCNEQVDNIVLFNANGTLTNGPSNFDDWKDGGTWQMETYHSKQTSPYNDTIYTQIIQKTTKDPTKRRAYRIKASGSWSQWYILDGVPTSQLYNVNPVFNGSIDCNAQTNNIVLFNLNATLTNGPDDSTFSDWKDGSTWCLVTYNTKDGSNNTYVLQTIYKLSMSKVSRTAARTKMNNTWTSWSAYAGAALNNVFHVGSGQTYTRLRDGIAAAVATSNATVYVHPGTYDLVSEFATEIAAATGEAGIVLKNGVHVIFYDGAKVTANFDNSESTYDATTWQWIYDHFQPFYADLSSASNNYILENLDIEASNTRYCVHDELGGSYTYRHEYKNCRMKYYTDHNPASYVQCIGGGMGNHGTIIIDGGYYETYSEYGISNIDSGDKDSAQQCISYHNGNSNDCYGTITVKNAYFKNRGYMRFGWYGSSDNTSQIQINGCSTGLPTLVRYETSGISTPKNFDLTEFCNELRNPSHWTLDANYYVATLVEDQ